MNESQPFRDEQNVNLLAKQISTILNENAIHSTTFSNWYDRVFIDNVDNVNQDFKCYLRISEEISDTDARHILNRIDLDMNNVLDVCKLRFCVYLSEDCIFIPENDQSEREQARRLFKQEIYQMQKNVSDEIQFLPVDDTLRKRGTPFFFDNDTTDAEFKQSFNAVMDEKSGRKVSRIDFIGKAKRAGAKIMQKVQKVRKAISGNFSTKNQGRNAQKILLKYHRIFNKLVSRNARHKKHREQHEYDIDED